MELFWAFLAFALGLCAFMYGGLFNDPTVMMSGLAGIGAAMTVYVGARPRKDNRYKDCMTSTARMEIECYGLIVSQSVQWWLTDTNNVVCEAHPFPDLPMQVSGHPCKCPPSNPGFSSKAPPSGRGSASSAVVNRQVTGGYIASGTIVAHICTPDCPHDSIIGGNGEVIAVYCTVNGRRWEHGIAPTHRSNPVKPERR